MGASHTRIEPAHDASRSSTALSTASIQNKAIGTRTGLRRANCWRSSAVHPETTGHDVVEDLRHHRVYRKGDTSLLSTDSARLEFTARIQLAGLALCLGLPYLLFVAEGSVSILEATRNLQIVSRESHCVESISELFALKFSLLLEMTLPNGTGIWDTMINATAALQGERCSPEATALEPGHFVLEELLRELDGIQSSSTALQARPATRNVTTSLSTQMRLETDTLDEGSFWRVASTLRQLLLTYDRESLADLIHVGAVFQLDEDLTGLNVTIPGLSPESKLTTTLQSAFYSYIYCIENWSPSAETRTMACFQELQSTLTDIFHSGVSNTCTVATAVIVTCSLAMTGLFLAVVSVTFLRLRSCRLLSEQLRVYYDASTSRTSRLETEKERTESLVYQMLPKAIADQLKTGKKIETESFNEVSIYFSDIVGFNEVALTISPIMVVDLLNTLYGAFDECIGKYDVYKVETIADSYLVVSGLPQRNGDRHAAEIAAMALQMMKVATEYSLPGTSETLSLRIGINSGPIVAGVIGLKNTRYCLFGDTINTASRMLSTGEAHKIHTSEAFMNSAQKRGSFAFSPRGSINVKGKGSMKTYWLTESLSQEAPSERDKKTRKSFNS